MSSPSPTPGSGGGADRLLARLDTSLTASTKSSKLVSVSARLDDATIDALFELDRSLTSAPFRQSLTPAHTATLVKLVLDRALPRSGESALTRDLCSACLAQLLEMNNNSLSLVYSECVTLSQHRDQSQRLAGLSALATLSAKFGTQLIRDSSDTITVLAKLSKRDELIVKELVLTAITNVYASVRLLDSLWHSEALKIVSRFADKSSDRSLRIMSARVMESIMTASSDGREADILMPLAIKSLLDPDIEVRLVNARAMGAILYATQSKDSARNNDVKQRKRLAYDVRSISDSLELIVKLFAKAPGAMLRASLSVAVSRLMELGCKDSDDAAISAHVMTLIGLVFKTRGPDSDREGRQLSACISDAIHRGILDHQSERGLESIAKSIVATLKHTTEAELNEFQVIVSCECLATCLLRLGDAVDGLELKDAALDSLLSLLSSPYESLRLHACQCLRILSLCCHSSVATWLSVIEKMIGIVMNDLLEGRGKSSDNHNHSDPWFSLHGHVSALTAIVGVSGECERGVSLTMIEAVFGIARRLITIDDSTPLTSAHATLSKLSECGWLLMAALVSLGTEFISPRLNALFGLWRSVLGRQPPTTPQKVDDIAADLRVRAASLTALRAFMHTMKHRMVLTPTTGTSAKDVSNSMSPVLKACRVFLATNLSLVKALHSAKDLEPVIVRALNAIKPPLFDCFSAVPPAAYTAYFSRILKLIVGEFTGSQTNANTELHRLVNPADAILTLPTSADTELVRFADLQDTDTNYGYESKCAAGNIAVNYSYQWYHRPDTHTLAKLTLTDDDDGSKRRGGNDGDGANDGNDSGVNRGHIVKHSANNNSDLRGILAAECYQNDSIRCVNASLRLFACLFADQSPAYQEQLMKHLLALVQKAKAAQALNSPLIVNIATALIGVCRDQTLRIGGIESQQAVHLMLSIAVDLLTSNNELVRRCAGESIGLIVQFEDESFLTKVMAVLREQSASKDSTQLCGAVFALGCVHRYGGGLRTIRELTLTVASLHAIARDFVQPLRIWCLHSLWLAIDSGGLSFVSAAQPTLAMIWAHTIYDIDVRPPVISLTLARIIVSVIAAFGPDINPALASATAASLGVERFSNIERHLTTITHSLVRAAVIEAVNERVIFNAINEPNELSRLLGEGLESHSEQLRRSAAKCVLRWGEKNVAVITEYRFDRALLEAIDRERSRSTQLLMQHAIKALIALYASRPSASTVAKPARCAFFESLRRVMATGASKQNSLMDSIGAPTKDSEAKADDVDEDEGIVKSAKPRGPAIADTNTAGTAIIEWRWQTKSFALSCLSQLLLACKLSLPATDFDLSYARKHRHYACEYVVDWLVDLLTVACGATSSPYDCMRLAGSDAMIHIVHSFSDVADPDATETEEPLLALYAAQVTSALSAALKNRSETIGSAPALRLKGCELTVALLTSGITSDENVVSRLVKTLLLPIQRPQDVNVWFAQYDGNASTAVILAHLAAVARLSLAVNQSAKTSKKKARTSSKLIALDAIEQSLKPQASFINNQLIEALRDFARLLVTPKKDLPRVKGQFFDGATATRVIDSFAPFWHTVLLAATNNITDSNHALLCLSIAASHLVTAYSTEIATLNRNKPVSHSDESETRRAETQTLACLDTITYILRHFQTNSSQYSLAAPVSGSGNGLADNFELFIELIPVLNWSLQYRLNAEYSLLQPRHQRAMQALTALADTVTINRCHSLTTAPEYCLSLYECLTLVLAQHCKQVYHSQSLLIALIGLLPSLLAFTVDTCHRCKESMGELNLSYFTRVSLSLCSELLRLEDTELLAAATKSFAECLQLVAPRVIGGSCIIDSNITANLLQQLTERPSDDEDARPLSEDRAVALLRCLWWVSIAPLSMDQSDLLSSNTQPSLNTAAITATVATLGQFLSSTNSELYGAGVQCLTQCVATSQASIPALFQYSHRSAAYYCYSVVLPLLVDEAVSATSSTRSLLASKALLAAHASMPADSPERSSTLSILVPTIIAALVDHPSLLADLMAIVASDTESNTFKSIVATLPDASKQALQAAALASQQQTDAIADGSTSRGGKEKAKKDKSKKKHRSSGESAAAARLNADDQIELKTDFTVFARRKEPQ